MSTQETAMKIVAENKLKICDLVIKACAELKEAEHLAENNKALPELHAIIQNRVASDQQGELEYVFRVAIATLPYSSPHVKDYWNKFSNIDNGDNGVLVERIIQRR